MSHRPSRESGGQYNNNVGLKYYPANAERNKHVIITSKRRLDVIITCYYVVCLQGSMAKWAFISYGVLILNVSYI